MPGPRAHGERVRARLFIGRYVPVQPPIAAHGEELVEMFRRLGRGQVVYLAVHLEDGLLPRRAEIASRDAQLDGLSR